MYKTAQCFLIFTNQNVSAHALCAICKFHGKGLLQNIQRCIHWFYQFYDVCKAMYNHYFHCGSVSMIQKRGTQPEGDCTQFAVMGTESSREADSPGGQSSCHARLEKNTV